MATSAEQIAHARDLFAGLGGITTGHMFSGTALYVEGDVMFAVILQDTIWMKSDTSTEADFRAAGSQPFTYDKKNGEQVVTSLMSLPESALDDPSEALEWAQKSLPPARAAAVKKRAAKARKVLGNKTKPAKRK